VITAEFGPAPDRSGAAGLPAAAVDAGDEGYSKTLLPRHVGMIAIGGAIGTGLFLGAGGNLAKAGPSLALSYAVCGVFAFFVVRALGELVMHRPSSGSFVSYSREFLGERGAYLAGWMYVLNWSVTGMADITAVALYLHYWSAFQSVPQWVLALFALGIVLAANLISVRIFGEMEFWFAIVKVAAIIMFLGIGVWLLGSGHKVGGYIPGLHLITSNGGVFPRGLSASIVILQSVVFAYAGVEMVGVTAGETAEPRKIVPKAVNSIMWRIAIFYVGSVIMLTLLLPWTSYSASQSPFVTALSKIGVPGIGGIMNLVVLTAAMSSLNSGLYSTGRILRSMATAGSAPGFTARMSRGHVPYGGILLTAGLALIGVGLNAWLPGEAFDVVVNIAALGVISAWSMIMVCHLVFVRRSRAAQALNGQTLDGQTGDGQTGDARLQRPEFRLWASPWTEIVTLTFLLGVVVLMAVDGGTIGRWTVALILPIGVCLYLGWRSVREEVGRRAAGVSGPRAGGTAR
jgi:L-asparagine permease